MWERTNAGACVPVALEDVKVRAVESHISPKEGEIWGTHVRWE
jgi:hypothetical protein